MTETTMSARAEGVVSIARGNEDEWPDYPHRWNSGTTLRPYLLRVELRYQGGGAWRVSGGNIFSQALRKDGSRLFQQVKEAIYGPGDYPDWAAPLVDEAAAAFSANWLALLENQD